MARAAAGLPTGPRTGDPLNALTLAETQQSLALALASIEAGFLATDRNARVTQLNQEAARVLGWTEAEAIGRSYWEVFAREGRPASHLQTNAVDLMLQQGLLVRDQQRVVAVARDGRRTLLHVNAALTHAPGGEVIGMIMVFRDLTGQAEAEALRQQEQERLRRVVEASPNGILLVDIQGQIALANRRAEDLFGHSPGSLEGANLAALVPLAAQAGHAQSMAGVFAQRQGRAMGAGRDVHGLRRDGTLVPLEIGLTPIEMPEGHFMLATLIDITERKQREDELRRSNADLEQFAYIASHDLQEPLRMVASYTELLAERYKGQLDERADKYIFYAVDGAKRMQRLVADLLAFARVGSQGKPLMPVDSGAVLAEVLRVLKPRLQAAGADVQAAGMPTVMADEDQLFQLLQNLVGNALKFRSEAPPCIRISAVREGEAWRFAVADNGIGIEPQYQERIFQMFQRLHERGRYEGSGIGLSIVKRILERHGGRIWLESALGQGSTFYFTLPGQGRAAPG